MPSSAEYQRLKVKRAAKENRRKNTEAAEEKAKQEQEQQQQDIRLKADAAAKAAANGLVGFLAGFLVAVAVGVPPQEPKISDPLGRSKTPKPPSSAAIARLEQEEKDRIAAARTELEAEGYAAIASLEQEVKDRIAAARAELEAEGDAGIARLEQEAKDRAADRADLEAIIAEEDAAIAGLEQKWMDRSADRAELEAIIAEEDAAITRLEQKENHPLPSEQSSPPPKKKRKEDEDEFYSVAVPNDVRPGTAFLVDAVGKRFEVTSPPNIGPGQTTRVALPKTNNNNTNDANKTPKPPSSSSLPSSEQHHLVSIPPNVHSSTSKPKFTAMEEPPVVPVPPVVPDPEPAASTPSCNRRQQRKQLTKALGEPKRQQNEAAKNADAKDRSASLPRKRCSRNATPKHTSEQHFGVGIESETTEKRKSEDPPAVLPKEKRSRNSCSADIKPPLVEVEIGDRKPAANNEQHQESTEAVSSSSSEIDPRINSTEYSWILEMPLDQLKEDCRPFLKREVDSADSSALPALAKIQGRMKRKIKTTTAKLPISKAKMKMKAPKNREYKRAQRERDKKNGVNRNAKTPEQLERRREINRRSCWNAKTPEQLERRREINRRSYRKAKTPEQLERRRETSRRSSRKHRMKLTTKATMKVPPPPTAVTTPVTSSPAATSSSAADSADSLAADSSDSAAQTPAQAKIPTEIIPTPKIPATSSPAATGSLHHRRGSSRQKRLPLQTRATGKPKKTTTERTVDTHGGSDPLELSALEGLCRLGGEQKFSFKCLICNEPVHANKAFQAAPYDVHSPLLQRNNTERTVVRLIREHCKKEHNVTWLWNVVPETKSDDANPIAPVDLLIHSALRAGGAHGTIPLKLTALEFVKCFSSKIETAISWLRWSRTTVTILNRVTRHASIRQDAERELVAIRRNGFTKIQSGQFVNEMKIYTLDQLFNKLMLIFFEMGRYKKCHIFGQVNILYP